MARCPKGFANETPNATDRPVSCDQSLPGVAAGAGVLVVLRLGTEK